MLDRVLEPEVMDTAEDADEYAAIDNTSVNDEFVSQALELAPEHGTVLDVGTGPGDIAISLAERGPGLHVVGIDLGEYMLAMARSNVVRARMEARVTIARADAKSTGQPSASFDMVVSNSVVHHVPEPLSFFAEAKRVARTGAAKFIKDLHRPDSLAEHEHLVKLHAGDCTPYQRRLFSDSLRAALTVDEVRALCAEAGLTGVEVRKTSDRHWCVERPAITKGTKS